jgi:4-amino-4-deoxy-L-arabinose transferase-like glycosyltransferase
VTVALLVPFLNKAFHIDDPVYVWVAERILESPLDFFGFQKNWNNRAEWLYEINKNPPGVSYYIAISALIFGWTELALHAAFLIPAACAAAGIYTLARQWNAPPALAAFIAVLTPAFLVSSTNIMADTLALAFYVWAVALWSKALIADKARTFALAAVLVGAGALVKYTVVTAIPLLAAYTNMHAVATKRSVKPLGYLALPVLILAAYDAYTFRLYNTGMIAEAMAFSSQFAAGAAARASAYKLAVGLSYAGGCYLPALFFAPFLWKPRMLVMWFAIWATVAAFLFSSTGLGVEPRLHDGHRIRWEFLLHYSLFVVSGVHLLALTVHEAWTRRDVAAGVVLCWIAGVFVFGAFVNWTVNVRSFLPMAPAVGILIARRIESENPARRWLPLIPAAALSLAVATIDYQYAETNRTVARETAPRIGENVNTVWFQARWGQRYYLEALGYRSIDIGEALENAGAFDLDFRLAEIGINPGDIVIVSEKHEEVVLPSAELMRLDAFDLRGPAWGATIDRTLGAGFYQYNWGPLPYAFGPVSTERITIYRATN